MATNDNANAAVATASLPSSAEGVHFLNEIVSRVAEGLVRVTVDEIDAEINLWLKRIGTDLHLDRSTIARIDPLTGLASFTHGWAREPYRPIRQPLDANRLLPWTVQRMLAGETVVMASPDKLPKEAAIDRRSFRRYGPESNVIVPIRAGGNVVGGMSFASLRRQRSWSAETVRAFQAIGQIFGFGLERKSALAEMIRLRNELNYVSRLNTMGELAASMAHELNQPLGAILTNAEALQAMLASDQPDLEEIRAGITDIIQDNNRARETIMRLWALFRRGEVTKSKIDLGEVLGEIGRIVRSDALLRGISLEIEVKTPLPLLLAERLQLQQAIINLILNAFDAVAPISDEARAVRIDALAMDESDSVELLVRDTGVGIAPEAIPHIFDPFFTTKPQGMGMGLAIAKSIIDAHGGTLSASPNSERGTTFAIRLPIANERVSC
jgi:signal transduction histidine kinase